MFKIIILSQIGADRYEKLIFEKLLLSPLGELCSAAVSLSKNTFDNVRNKVDFPLVCQKNCEMKNKKSFFKPIMKS